MPRGVALIASGTGTREMVPRRRPFPLGMLADTALDNAKSAVPRTSADSLRVPGLPMKCRTKERAPAEGAENERALEPAGRALPGRHADAKARRSWAAPNSRTGAALNSQTDSRTPAVAAGCAVQHTADTAQAPPARHGTRRCRHRGPAPIDRPGCSYASLELGTRDGQRSPSSRVRHAAPSPASCEGPRATLAR